MTCEKCKEKDTEIAKRDRIISAMCNGISRIVNERDLDETTEDALYALLEINHKAPWQDRSPEAPEIIATDTKEYEMTGGGKARITVSIIKTPEAPARERAESRGSQRDGATVNPEPQRISSAPEETMECTCCRINMKKKKYKDGGEYWNCPQCDKVYDIVPK